VRRVLVAGIALLLVASCARDGSPPVAVDPSPTPTRAPVEEPPSSPSPTPSPAADEAQLEVWFNDGERLAVAYRSVPRTVAVGRAAVEELLRGPGSDDVGGTQIPKTTRLLGLSVSGGVATVDLSRDFGSGGGSLSMTMRVAQVVYTLTQFPTVDSVRFHIDGEPGTALSGEGVDISKPLRRRDFTDLAPPIVVSDPRPGATLSPGARVAGDANVFEATVSIRLLDADGEVLVDTFTTATCGTGCRGTFEKRLRFAVDAAQDGLLEVFAASAEDGSPQHVVAVPVRLVP